MFDKVKTYHRPPQYAVSMDIFERLLAVSAISYSSLFGTYVNMICSDISSGQLYSFTFSERDLGAGVWLKRCEN